MQVCGWAACCGRAGACGCILAMELARGLAACAANRRPLHELAADALFTSCPAWCATACSAPTEALFRVTALRRRPADEAGVCCGPPDGLSAVAEVSVLHCPLGQEASAGITFCSRLQAHFALSRALAPGLVEALKLGHARAIALPTHQGCTIRLQGRQSSQSACLKVVDKR